MKHITLSALLLFSLSSLTAKQGLKVTSPDQATTRRILTRPHLAGIIGITALAIIITDYNCRKDGAVRDFFDNTIDISNITDTISTSYENATSAVKEKWNKLSSSDEK